MENGAETADEGVIALIAGAGGLDPARARAVLSALRDAGVLAVPSDGLLVPLSREDPKVDDIALDGDQTGYTLARTTGPCTCISPAGPDGARTIARFRTDEGAAFYLVAGAWSDHLLPARVRRSYDDAGGRPDFTPCGDGTTARGLFDAVAVRVVFSAVGGARHFACARLDAAVGVERPWDRPVWVLEAVGGVSEVDRATAEYAMGEGTDGGTIDGDSPVDWHMETVVVPGSERGVACA